MDAKIGDNVTVTIKGKIVAEVGDNWVIELALDFIDGQAPAVLHFAKSLVKRSE